MSDTNDSRLKQSDTYASQLKEQFERINRTVESGGTVTLDLTENGRSITLNVGRDSVVKSDAPRVPRVARGTLRRSGDDSRVGDAAGSYSFDVGDINRRVSNDHIEAQIKEHEDVKADGKSGRVLRAAARGSTPSAKGVPDPVITYVGDTWVLHEDCVYTTNDMVSITAKSGFRTDLASIPRIFWVLIASYELSLAAPLVHDLIYRSAGEVMPPDGEVSPGGKVFTREEADDIFLELMTRAKVPYWKRNVAYLAVSYFGEDSWRKLR